MTPSLSGKRALITGAGSGLGMATAEMFAKAGARVCLSYFPASAPPQAALDRIKAAGGEAFMEAADVADEAAVAAHFKSVLPKLGGLDIVVNAAGVMFEQALIGHDTRIFDYTMAVNVRGTFLVGRAGAASMRQSGASGRIINFASDLGYLGRANFSAYCASKGAVLALTRSWARELAPDILVNAIAPGPLETPMLRNSLSNPDVLDQELDSPLARIGTPEDAAACALFLAGPDSTFMTGQTMHPNGGSVMP